MPAHKGTTDQKIQAAAAEIFLEYGFLDTTMSMIAQKVGISTPAIYKHFSGKQELYASLVDPLIETVQSIFKTAQTQKETMFEERQEHSVWDKSNTIDSLLDFVYAHFTEMRLLLCASEGTGYELMVDKAAAHEADIIISTLPYLRKQGITSADPDPAFIHLLTKHYYRSEAEIVIQNMSKEDAKRYAESIDRFFTAGWRDLLGF